MTTDATAAVRVGLSLPSGVLSGRASSWAAMLALMADCGLDHAMSADHISFHTGWGIDGLIHATTIAALEPRLDVAVGVYLLPLRHPVPVARQLSTFSAAFPGRLEFGVGIGGEDPREVAMCGVDPKTRGRRMDACLAILRALVHGETVTHDSEFFHLDGARITPAPSPPVPIVVGGRAPAALRRAGRNGDGWLGIWSTADRYQERVQAVEVAAADAGRGPVSWRHGLQLWMGVGEESQPYLAAAMEGLYRLPYERFARFSPWGRPEQLAEYLQPYVAVGCRSFSVAAHGRSWERTVEGMGEVRRLMNPL